MVDGSGCGYFVEVSRVHEGEVKGLTHSPLFQQLKRALEESSAAAAATDTQNAAAAPPPLREIKVGRSLVLGFLGSLVLPLRLRYYGYWLFS